VIGTGNERFQVQKYFSAKSAGSAILRNQREILRSEKSETLKKEVVEHTI
jgi:hypothetical protein